MNIDLDDIIEILVGVAVMVTIVGTVWLIGYLIIR